MMDDCLFCKMASGAVPVAKLLENEQVFAIRDINPRAPVHVLIIPKQHIPTVQQIAPEHGSLLAAMFAAANETARGEGIGDRGYRCAFNVLGDAGMTIWHLHLHMVGGRKLGPEG